MRGGSALRMFLGAGGAGLTEFSGDCAEGDGLEIAAEAPAGWVVAEVGEVVVEGEEDLLGDIVAVGGLEAASAGEGTEELGVSVVELAPGVGVVARGEAGQEGCVCGGLSEHGASLPG